MYICTIFYNHLQIPFKNLASLSDHPTATSPLPRLSLLAHPATTLPPFHPPSRPPLPTRSYPLPSDRLEWSWDVLSKKRGINTLWQSFGHTGRERRYLSRSCGVSVSQSSVCPPVSCPAPCCSTGWSSTHFVHSLSKALQFALWHIKKKRRERERENQYLIVILA